MTKKRNTFQFVSFNERIKKTHVDVVRQYKTFGSLQPIDAETFFSEILEKWSDLNGTAHFDDFKRSIPRSELHTYVQILHHQKEIATSLMASLKVDGSMCIPALLDLTVALCRDLQEDFYVYFWDFFEIIQDILRNTTSENADLIESCFTAYAYLFKFCRRRMVLELDVVLERLIPLISNKKYYVRRFVSESLAFLMRKCPNFTRLVKVCDSMINENGRLIEGISDIFFESMKSIRSQLHTVAPEIYLVLLNHETESGLELTKLVTAKLASSIEAKNLQTIFEVLLKKTELEIGRYSDDFVPNWSENLFDLWSIWADSSTKAAKDPLMHYVKDIFEKISIPAISSDLFIIDNGSLKSLLYFISKFWQSLLPEHHIYWKKIMQILLEVQRDRTPVDLILEFLESLLKNFEPFQSIVLPIFIGYTEFYFDRDDQLSIEKRSLLHFWAKITNEHRSIVDDNFDQSNAFYVKYSRKMPRFVKFLQDFLSVDIQTEQNFNLHAAITVYSGFSKNFEPVLKTINRILHRASKDMASDDCLLYFLTIRCLKEIETDENSIKNIPFEIFLDQLKNRSDFLPLLNVFHEILCDFPFVIEKMSTNLDLLKILENNFLSPSSSVRMKTLQILTKLKWSTTNVRNEQNLFDLALESESIDLYLDTYRDRLVCYRKFGFTEYERLLPEPADQLRFVPLKFLLGQLNVNFTLLLPTLQELIESHARGQKQNEFWAIFGQILTFCHDKTSMSIESDAVAMEVDSNIDSFWSSVIDEFAAVDERRGDYANFRLLLWKTMENFADLAEPKTRFLSELLLNVARKEMVSIDFNTKMDQNLTEDDLYDDDQPTHRSDDAKRRKSFLTRTLTAILKVFSKFNNPKSVSKEEKLYQLYLDLLMHGRCDIQVGALECILAYKSKFLSPYRDHLLNLLDNQSFKDQLVLFNIDSDANVVDPEHRADVMQILLRLLYGRLLGKGSDEYRKQQIYRYLAGSTEQELKIFLEFMFLPFKTYLDPQSTVTQICSSISIDYDLTKSVPLRKIMGILSHLSTIIKRLGHILIDYRSILFRICCVSGSILSAIQTRKDQVRPHYIKFCKKLRRLLTQRFTEFFVQFDSYEFDPEEIRTFFQIGVCPLAENLHKNVAQPSVDLIKLCLTLSGIPRYFVLLGIYDPSSNCQWTLLELLLALFVGKECRKSIKNTIATIVFNLLSAADYESNDDTGSELKIPDNFVLRIWSSFDDQIENDQTTLGTKLILPYSDQLLTYLSSIATVTVCRDEKWMKILTVLSEYTKDVTNCEHLTTILLSVLKSKKIRNVEIEASILISVQRLLKCVSDPLSHANTVAELLYIIENRSSRNILIDIVRFFGQRQHDLQHVATILDDVNSWSDDRVEEPNFDRIQSGYSTMNKILSHETVQLNFVGCSLLARNCAFHMTKAIDFSLRDQSADCCRNLIESSSKRFEMNEARKLLNMHILPVLRIGLKSKTEAIRHEFITILATCVKSFKPEHPKLEGFVELTDINDDDLNFFENIRHIQLHRRSRAIRRICDKLETSTIHVHSESLFNYIYPIFYAFFFDAAYTKNSNLIDEAVRFLGVFCHRAPWARYETMLKYFLDRLKTDAEHQKLMVKIIVAILDAFHFNISGVDDQPAFNGDAPEENRMGVDEDYGAKKRIFDTIVKKFIPELQTSLSKRTSTEFVHKTTAKFVYDEEEEILRIPIALTIVKLLKKLPEKHLDLNLPGVIAKVCQMLKIRSFEIRETARDMLCRMAGSLGSRYAAYIIREMRAILRRGYQVHVLTYTVHVLLTYLTERLSPGDLEPCLNDVLSICVDDLFGDIAQQKEHDEITKKLKEAKANKTNATLQILGRLIDPASLDTVVHALRNVLDKKYSLVTVGKVGEALKFFSQGLIFNTSLSTEHLMTFIHKVLTNNLAAMFEVGNPAVVPEHLQPVVIRQSCYVLEPEPSRSGIQPKKSKRSNVHIMTTFGLEILHNLLKTKRLEPTNQQHCSLMDPFLSLFVELSKAKQPKVVTLALRCLSSSLQFTLPSMPTHCPAMIQHLFVLLKRFAGAGATSSKGGENVELLTVVFKTVTLMIKELEYCSLNANQLRILLQYAEEDLFDIQKQSTAFALIKAILTKKFNCDELKSLMKRVEELSIVSQIELVRLQCRQVISKYMSSYSEGKRPKRVVEFFCAQLEYEYEDGRISAIEMIQAFIDFFTIEHLNEFSLFIFIHLSLRLVNDESPKIKQLSSVTVKNLLIKLDPGKFESICQMIFEWLKDENDVHKKLAAILLGLTSAVGQPTTMISSVLSAIVDQLICSSKSTVNLVDSQVSGSDHVIYLLLTDLEKYLVLNTTIVRDAKFTRLMNDIWDLAIKFVDHEHVWVRLAACRLIGLMLSHYKPEELLCFDISSDEFLLRNSKSTVGLLCEAFLRRFRAVGCSVDLSEQVIKNLVFLSRCVRHLTIAATDDSSSRATTPTEEDAVAGLLRKRIIDAQVPMTLERIAQQLVRVCRQEVSKYSAQTVKRSNVFKWIAAVCLNSSVDEFSILLPIVLPSLQRELSIPDSDQNLKQLAVEVVEMIKNKIGMAIYSTHLAKIQKNSSVKRLDRKRKLADDAVNRPEMTAMRKMRRHQSRIESRKTKFLEKIGKKSKKSDENKSNHFHLNIEDD